MDRVSIIAYNQVFIIPLFHTGSREDITFLGCISDILTALPYRTFQTHTE